VRRTWLVALLGCLAWPCSAQTKGGHARGEGPTIVLGLTAGYLFRASLFEIGNQPYPPSDFPGQFDTLRVQRSTRYSTTFGVSIAYYPRPHFGLSGEVGYLGIGTDGSCKVGGSQLSSETTEVCESLDTARTNASAMMIAVGGNYRAFSRSGFSPFLSVKVGAMIAADNPNRLYASYFIEDRSILLRQYDDGRQTVSSWYAMAGVGFSILAAPGYRMRFEARDNILRLPIPAGPSDPPRSIYPRTSVIKHLISINFGFDIVLQARPGRRY